MRFNKKQRLLNKAEFDSVFNKSQKVSSKLALALYRPNSLDTARLGVIVSKKVSKSAVVRNQIKRVIRESFRINQDRLIGIDIILLMRQNETLPDKTQLREAIEQLWERIIQQRQKS